MENNAFITNCIVVMVSQYTIHNSRTYLISLDTLMKIPTIRDLIKKQNDLKTIKIDGDPHVFEILISNIESIDFENSQEYLNVGIAYQHELTKYGFKKSPGAVMLDKMGYPQWMIEYIIPLWIIGSIIFLHLMGLFF